MQFILTVMIDLIITTSVFLFGSLFVAGWIEFSLCTSRMQRIREQQLIEHYDAMTLAVLRKRCRELGIKTNHVYGRGRHMRKVDAVRALVCYDLNTTVSIPN